MCKKNEHEKPTVEGLQAWVLGASSHVREAAEEGGDAALLWVSEYNRRLAELKSTRPAVAPAEADPPAEDSREGRPTMSKKKEEAFSPELEQQAMDFVNRYFVDRRGSACKKWDGIGLMYSRTDLLPLWIADMDFCLPEAFEKRFAERLHRGALGYGIAPDSYYEAVGDWLEAHFGYRPAKEEYLFSPGVVSGLFWCVEALTKEGDGVVCMTPVYPPIQKAATDTGRRLLCCPLLCDAEANFTIDFERLEQIFREEQPKALIQCSPHNPIGRVWRQAELERLFELCARYDVLIFSDEIHQDINHTGHPQISAYTVSGGRYHDRLVVLHSVSKTFNLAGLAHSNVIIPDAKLRERVQSWLLGYYRGAPSVLGLLATETVYREKECREWYDGLMSLIQYNDQLLRGLLAEHVPAVRMPRLEGTYLCFLDLSAYVAPDETRSFLEGACRLALNYGETFGAEYGSWVRLNLATKPDIVCQAADRLITGLLAKGLRK